MKLYVKIWYSQTGHRQQYNTAHVLCMLNNKGYKHTLRKYVTLIFFHGNNGCVNAPQCDMMHALPCLV